MVALKVRTGGSKSPVIIMSRLFQSFFSHCSNHDCFRSVSVDTQITYFHIVSRQIDFSSNIRRNIMIRTKGYHSPVILITEHVAVITKDSITLFCQYPAYFLDFTLS